MNRYFLNPPNDDKKDNSPPPAERKDDTLSQIKEVDQRRHEVLDYMLLQMTEEEIAEELGEELATIKKDIRKIQEQGFKGREDDLKQIRAEVVSKLRYTWTEGRRAFKKSQGKVQKRTVKYGEGGEGEVDQEGERKEGGPIEEEKIQTKEQAGDAKFLQVMNDSAEKMAKVTGAQKHKEVEINNNMQHNTTNILSPSRSKLPEEYDQFLDKPEGEMTPDQRRAKGLDDIENEDI